MAPKPWDGRSLAPAAVTVAWSRHALDDLEGIWRYIAADDLAAAEALVGRIDSAAEAIGRFPGGGRAGRVPGTREHPVARTRYVLVYRVRGDDVQLLRVLHGAQRWPGQDT
jgi:toxin ParE1/3/4